MLIPVHAHMYIMKHTQAVLYDSALLLQCVLVTECSLVLYIAVLAPYRKTTTTCNTVYRQNAARCVCVQRIATYKQQSR